MLRRVQDLPRQSGRSVLELVGDVVTPDMDHAKVGLRAGDIDIPWKSRCVCRATTGMRRQRAATRLDVVARAQSVGLSLRRILPITG